MQAQIAYKSKHVESEVEYHSKIGPSQNACSQLRTLSGGKQVDEDNASGCTEEAEARCVPV